jgi:hypothetical protein
MGVAMDLERGDPNDSLKGFRKATPNVSDGNQLYLQNKRDVLPLCMPARCLLSFNNLTSLD